MKQLAFIGLIILIAIPSLSSAEPASSEDASRKALWTRPRSSEREKERLRLVRWYVKGGRVKDEKIIDAMKNVPRHWFVRAEDQREAYEDHPLPIGHGQTISQPSLVAYMTQLLELDEKSKVLEIGTGSGYQAAILNELTPHVYSIEIIKELAEEAKKRLKKRGYKAIEVKHADGYHGWKKHAPFDAIIVAAAATHVPPPLFEQLKVGGKMVIPIGPPMSVQTLNLVTKEKDGKPVQKSILSVRFVPLTDKVR